MALPRTGCQHRAGMLAALNLVAVIVGIGAGGLTAAVLALLFAVAAGAFDRPPVEEIGVVVGVLSGLLVSGAVAGRMARHSARFHGAVAGVGVAGLLVVMARLGGSPASPLTVLWLALLSALFGGASGWWAGKRERERS